VNLKVGKYILFIGLLQLLFCQQFVAAQDSLTVSPEKKAPRKYIPMKATMYAATVPGFGQVYNRKYWKIPIVYAGFGALGYSVVFNTKNYNTYLQGYQDFTDKIPATDSYLDLVVGLDPARYDPVLYPESYNVSDEAWVKDHLLRGVDYYRRYRDLTYIGIAAWYIVSILDANVDASLSDYDINENINITLAPLQVPGYYFTALGINVSLKINF
jgi:hypothetical protein